jgi:hypothetical protein
MLFTDQAGRLPSVHFTSQFDVHENQIR